MRIILLIVIYVGGFITWIFDVVVPFGKKILLHIQNHANNNDPLDLIYCAKQLGAIIGYGFLIYIVVYLLMLFISLRDQQNESWKFI